MPCILRIEGDVLDFAVIIGRFGMKADSTYKKGEAKIKSLPHKGINQFDGITFMVSDADFDDFEKQKLDAIHFLSDKKDEIQKILTISGVSAELDFGIKCQLDAVQCDRLPSDLIRLVGLTGISLSISRYLLSEN